jgi:hypothetical protein
MQGQSNQTNYQKYDYQDDYIEAYANPYKKLNLLEIGTACLSIILLISVLAFGFFSQSAKNRDSQRSADIEQVLDAIISFYQNSSTVPSQRYYPIANCSSQLNEVDFEFSLRQYLTGQVIQSDPHAYILPQEFPKDSWGVYSTALSQRELRLRDCPKVFSNLTQNSTNVYEDTQIQSCNFDLRQSKYKKCYLYGSSTSGDKFELGYYNESQGVYIVYSKFRDGNIKLERVTS